MMDTEIIGHEVVGDGPCKVLVLHGWLGDHTIWAPAYRFIDQDAFAFAFVDYRGYGASRNLAGRHSIAEMAADAVALANHLGWRSFCVVGHSMGGQVAQRIALDAAGRVLAVVGIAPVPAMGVKMPPDAAAFFAAAADSDEVGCQIVDVSLGHRLKPDVARQIMRFARETSDREAFRQYGEAFIQTDFGEAAKAITAPMLILVGEYDGGVTEASVRSSFPALYPHVEIEVLPNAGHYPMLETPAWLMTRVEGFLAEHVPARPS